MSATLPMSINVELSRVQNLLCCAMEGGSGYWAKIKAYQKPVSLDVRSDEEVVFRHLDYPVNPGGAVMILDVEESKIYTLDLEAIRRGLSLFATKAPRHLANFLDEQEDAVTGDVFLQLCLLGDVVYG